MGALAGILAYLFGDGIKTVTLPILALTLCTSLYHNFTDRRDRATNQAAQSATNQCNAGWNVAISKSRERQALARAEAAEQLIEGERNVNEGLSNELRKIREESDELRRKVAGTDGKCLSDGVLSILK